MNFVPWKVITTMVIIVTGLYLGYTIQNFFHDRNGTNLTDQKTVVSLPQNQGVSTDLNEDSYVLDLTGQNILELPNFVLAQKSITHLILTDNLLSSLPSQVGEFTKLSVLDVSKNHLSGTLPGEIRLMQLVDLNASNNNLTGIPAEIGQIDSLLYVDFSNNDIKTLPNEITNLVDLKWLNLSGNPIEEQVITKLRKDMPSTIINF
jgi:Leucine-rich repeat (LRR) protein